MDSIAGLATECLQRVDVALPFFEFLPQLHGLCEDLEVGFSGPLLQRLESLLLEHVHGPLDGGLESSKGFIQSGGMGRGEVLFLGLCARELVWVQLHLQLLVVGLEGLRLNLEGLVYVQHIKVATIALGLLKRLSHSLASWAEESTARN